MRISICCNFLWPTWKTKMLNNNKYLKVSKGGIRSKKHAAWPLFSLFFLLLKIVVYDLAMN